MSDNSSFLPAATLLSCSCRTNASVSVGGGYEGVKRLLIKSAVKNRPHPAPPIKKG